MLDCLVIDDEESIAVTICEYFNLFNVSCEYAVDYDTAMHAASEKQPSLILLDINLDGKSGFELCKKLRETSDVPVIFISARNTDDDILAALGIGGDDYVTKPFSMAVLLARAKAVLKRTSAQKPSQALLQFGDVEIDRASGRVTRSGENVKLKPMELKLLLYLFDNQGRRVTKDELLFGDRMKNCGANIFTCTDDGTCGFKGFATHRTLDLLEDNNYDMAVVCGPEIMMKGIFDLLQTHSILGQYSMERYMKCALGICGQCCMDKTGWRVCIEGPVFTNKQLKLIDEFGKYHRDASGIKKEY